MLDAYINKKGTKSIYNGNVFYDYLYGKNKERPSLIMTEEEKFEDDKERLKKIIDEYERIGEEQVAKKANKYRKLYNFTKGIIDKEDYVQTVDDYKESFNDVDEITLTEDIKFYPIIPNILDLLTSKVEKMFSHYEARAVDEHATNDYLEYRNKILQDTLINSVKAMFDFETQEQIEQQTNSPEFQQLPQDQQAQQIDAFYKSRQDLFGTMPKVQDYMNKDWRNDVETWANLVIKIAVNKFDIKKIERKVFESIFITDDPRVHVDLMGDKVNVEVWDESLCFELKSPEVTDLSESIMAGRFRFLNFGSILNTYGGLLKPEDVEILEEWSNFFTGANTLIPNNRNSFFTGQNTDTFDSLNNLMYFKNMTGDSMGLGGAAYSKENFENQNIIRVTEMYFLVPRKIGYLTYKSTNPEYPPIKDVVDEFYKPTFKPVYSTRNKTNQNETTLISGEHIDWRYKNELWKTIKINLDENSVPFIYKSNQNKDYTKEIYVVLEKSPIQYKAKGLNYGVKIPIHGGSITSRKSKAYSPTERMSNFQILYNYIYNRIDSLSRTEIGEFFVFDQNELPNESMNQSWNKDPMIAFQTAHDTGFMPLDRSVTNMGQASASGAMGQVINLNRTQDLITKVQLANLFKQECYSVLGITPPMLAEVTPYVTAKAVGAGLQASNDQIQPLFTRLSDIMRDVMCTVVEAHQYLVSTGVFNELNYVGDDGIKELFKLPTETFEKLSIYDLGIYVKNDIRTTEILENLKNLAINDNTMGADAYEKATILEATNVNELLDKLAKFKRQRQREIEQQREFEAQQQEQLIQHQQEMQDKEIERQNMRDMEDRKVQIAVAQIKALGYANDVADNIQNEILQLQTSNQFQQQLYSTNFKNQLDASMASTQRSKLALDQNKANNELILKNKELNIREAEVDAANKRTKAMLKAKTNNKK